MTGTRHNCSARKWIVRGGSELRIIASDSGGAVLDEGFGPEKIVAASAVLVKPPYTQAEKDLSVPIFEDTNSQNIILREMKLSRELLKHEHADIIHLDMTLGSVSILDLTLVKLEGMRLSREAKDNIRRQLPHLRSLAAEIKRVHSIDVLAIGKKSGPIRIAELIIAAHSLIYCSEKVIEEKTPLILGLPTACTVKKTRRGALATSLISTEEELLGFAEDENMVLSGVKTKEMVNPILRGFRIIQIQPK